MPPEADAQVLRILSLAPEERRSDAATLRLEDPEVLLAMCAHLKSQGETNPARVRTEAEFLYDFLEKPYRPIGLFDEREYFLGETALLAGSACRMLFRRDEARLWFDRSEAAFRQTVNAVGDWARVSYQRLALRVEERDFDRVLELLPSLIESFRRLSMAEDSLKARFLEGVSLMNLGRNEEALQVFREICVEARRIGSERLLAIAANNLVQIHAQSGDTETALDEAQRTLQLMFKLDNRVGLAKLQWGVGTLLRAKGNVSASIEAFQASLKGFSALEMRSDVAALHLVLADAYLETGDEAASRRHVLEALPVIQEDALVPEGFAAMALLQESLKKDRVDPNALRAVHGFFGDSSR